MKNLYHYIHKYVFIPLFYHQNKLQKIQQYINTLNKRPSSIILSIKLSGYSNQKQQFIYLLQTIQKIYPSTISIFFNGQTSIVEKFLQYTHNLIQNSLIIKDQNQNNYDKLSLNIIKQSQFYSNLAKPVNQKKVPLIISMTDCQSVNNLPYTYLINGQIGFCPLLTNCGRSDIVNCFQQYANSNQRHGK